MIDERLGMAAGALLRDEDRPATDPRRSIGRVMAQVHQTPQARRSRLIPFFGRGTIPVRIPRPGGRSTIRRTPRTVVPSGQQRHG